MAKEDKMEQYQGIIIARSNEVAGWDMVYYGPSQRKEFDEYSTKKTLPDGRKVILEQWLDAPLDRISIDGVARDLIAENTLPVEEVYDGPHPILERTKKELNLS